MQIPASLRSDFIHIASERSIHIVGIRTGALLVTRDLSGDLERAANVTARQQYLAGQVSADAAELTSLERGSVLAAMLVDAAHQQAYQQEFSVHATSLRKSRRGDR